MEDLTRRSLRRPFSDFSRTIWQSNSICFVRPVEEFGSEGVICLNFENLGDQIGGYPAELAEFGGDVGAPLVVVSAEGIDDEARDRGEA